MFFFRGLRDGEWLKCFCFKIFGKVFGFFFWYEILFEIRVIDFFFLIFVFLGFKLGCGFEFSIVILFFYRKFGFLNYDLCFESCFGVVFCEVMLVGLYW